jgi:hypothetical protein
LQAAFALLIAATGAHAQNAPTASERAAQETGRFDRQAARESHKKMCIELGQCDGKGNVLKTTPQDTNTTQQDTKPKKKKQNNNGQNAGNQNKPSQSDGRALRFQRSF